MKQKMKKIFENAIWWSGVVMVGLVLGLTIQFVKAWTEPTEAPPGGNVGAPINTSSFGQFKQGVLQLLGFTLYNNPDPNGDSIFENDVTGKVLTAQNAYGSTAWAAGGGGGGHYTAWGTTGCAPGYTVAYTGAAIIFASGWGNQGPICSGTALTNNNEAGGWQDTKHQDTRVISCAVCVK